MEILIRLRPVCLILFVLGVAVMLHAMANRDEFLYIAAAAFGFSGMTVYLMTESFGRIAQARHSASRWIARILLIPCTLISVSAVVLIVRWSFHNIGA